MGPSLGLCPSPLIGAGKDAGDPKKTRYLQHRAICTMSSIGFSLVNEPRTDLEEIFISEA
jgi:hypothetical protein